VFILVRIGIGAVYALVAMSFNIVHNSSGILNFAQGNRALILGGLFGFFTRQERALSLAVAGARLGAAAGALQPSRAGSLCCRSAHRSSSTVADHDAGRVGDDLCSSRYCRDVRAERQVAIPVFRWARADTVPAAVLSPCCGTAACTGFTRGR
jgi:hypothetical protein